MLFSFVWVIFWPYLFILTGFFSREKEKQHETGWVGGCGGSGKNWGMWRGYGKSWGGGKMIKIYCMEKKIKKEKESPGSKNKTLTRKELRATTLDPVITFSTCILPVVALPQERLEGERNERKQRNDAG